MPREVIMRTVSVFLASCLVPVAVLLLPPFPAHALPNFTEGMWEMKGEVTFEGGMKIGGKTIPLKPVKLHYSKCLTKKDMAPYKEEKNQRCTKTSEKWSGHTVTWAFKCTEPNGTMIENTGSAVFSSTSFDGKMHSVMTDPQGGKSKANGTMKGHRTGPCK
jgi:hypothetical protein